MASLSSLLLQTAAISVLRHLRWRRSPFSSYPFTSSPPSDKVEEPKTRWIAQHEAQPQQRLGHFPCFCTHVWCCGSRPIQLGDYFLRCPNDTKEYPHLPHVPYPAATVSSFSSASSSARGRRRPRSSPPRTATTGRSPRPASSRRTSCKL